MTSYQKLHSTLLQARHPASVRDGRQLVLAMLRSSWARLIKKVYEADALVCPRCGSPLKIISLIDSAPVIERILRHLKLWDRPERPPPRPAERSIQYDEEAAGFIAESPEPDAAG
jgi:hypothetical protein